MPEIIDLGFALGASLKRLVMDLQSVYRPYRGGVIRPHSESNNFLLDMPLLEELVCNYDVPGLFSAPPPNLKKLAVTIDKMTNRNLDFCFSAPKLEILYYLGLSRLTTAQAVSCARDTRVATWTLCSLESHREHRLSRKTGTRRRKSPSSRST
jgi:hypothetical protein